MNVRKEQLICLPGEFDRRLKSDQELRGSIAGFSSLSLTDTQRGLTENGYLIPPFSSNVGGVIYADLHPSVYRTVFGKMANMYRGLNPLLSDNRSYGRSPAIIEYVMSQPFAPEDYKVLDADITDEIIGLVDKTRTLSKRQIDNMLKDYTSPSNFLDDIFPSLVHIRDALVELRNRGGIQTIYGNRPDFIDFLRENRAIPCDDSAAEIPCEIPSELVIALIPLGESEQNILLTTSKSS